MAVRAGLIWAATMTMIAMLALASLTSGISPRCSIVRRTDVYVREPTETWIVGTVLPDAIEMDSARAVKARIRHPARAHAVLVESVVGAGASRTLQRGDTVAIFTWSLGPDCSRSASRILTVGSRHHFEVGLWPDSAWVQGVATLGVDPAGGLGIYPGTARNNPPITVDEYATFVSLIPTRADWDLDCRPGVQRMNAWITAHVYGGQPGVRPFGRVAESLVGACEMDLQSKANALRRHGTSTLPDEIGIWARQEGCQIESEQWSNMYYATPGRFQPGLPDSQWAVVCATENDWRLLVIVPREGKVLAELVRSVGSGRQRELYAAPPEFFHWAALYDPNVRDATLPRPEFDAILFDNFGYFWRNGRWSAAFWECCYFKY